MHGHLTLGPRPRLSAVPGLLDRADVILCALLPQEQPDDLLRAYGPAGLHVPFSTFGRQDPGPGPAAAVALAADLIRDGAVVHVHCAAGIHRTGSLAYSIWRGLGLERIDAVTALRAREATWLAFTGRYSALIDWSDRYLVHRPV